MRLNWLCERKDVKHSIRTCNLLSVLNLTRTENKICLQSEPGLKVKSGVSLAWTDNNIYTPSCGVYGSLKGIRFGEGSSIFLCIFDKLFARKWHTMQYSSALRNHAQILTESVNLTICSCVIGSQ